MVMGAAAFGGQPSVWCFGLRGDLGPQTVTIRVVASVDGQGEAELGPTGCGCNSAFPASNALRNAMKGSATHRERRWLQ